MSELVQLVVQLDEPRERAAVTAALSGPGRPIGVRSCEVAEEAVIIEVDAQTTPLALIRHLVAIERRRFDDGGTARVDAENDASTVATAIGDPALGDARTLEYHLPELNR